MFEIVISVIHLFVCGLVWTAAWFANKLIDTNSPTLMLIGHLLYANSKEKRYSMHRDVVILSCTFACCALLLILLHVYLIAATYVLIAMLNLIVAHAIFYHHEETSKEDKEDTEKF